MKKLLILTLMLAATQLSSQNFYEELNAIRKERGISPIKKSIFLQIGCKRWAKKCVNKYNAHVMHDRSAGKEVIAYNVYPVEFWMNSPSHRRIILHRGIKKVGFAQYEGYSVARFR